MVGGQCAAVHLVGEQDVVERLPDRDRPADAPVVDAAGHVRVVEPLGQHVDRAAPESGPVEHLAQRHAAPARHPMPPSFHGVPLAGVPCWVPKKLRPLPAHSITEVRLFEGSRSRSR